MKTTPLIIAAALAASVQCAPLPLTSYERAAARAAANPSIYIISPFPEESHIPSTSSIEGLRSKHRPDSSPDQIRVVRPVAVENSADPASTKPSGNERAGGSKGGKGAVDDYGKQGVTTPVGGGENVEGGQEGGSGWQKKKRSVPEAVHPGFTFGSQTPAALDAIIADEDAEKDIEKEKVPPSSQQKEVDPPRQKMSKWNKYLVIPVATVAVVVLGLGAAAYERQAPGWQSNESQGYKN